MTSPLPAFDVREIPFSRRGSWLNLSPVIALHTTAHDLHLVSHQTGLHAVLRLIPWRSGAAVSSTVHSRPDSLEWRVEGGGTVQAVFAAGDTVRLRGRGAGIRIEDAASELTPFTGTYLVRDPVDDSAVFTSYETGRRYRVTPLRGDIVVDGAEVLGDGARALTIADDEWEVAIEEFDTARAPYRADESFDDLVAAVAVEFRRYLDRIAPWRDERTPAAALAAYVIWSATVAPAGFLQRESVLMSKHWMDKVWSWDHCFNALALGSGLADEAVDQFLVPFDHQDDSGALPDSVAHSEVLYNFVKPPIHGWALRRLRADGVRMDDATLVAVHERLAWWSRFWLDRRRAPGAALPYYQHGNDSGWDNSTTFDRDRLIESPDLAAFLAVQLDVLADLTDELERDGAQGWRDEAAAIRAAVAERLWRGDHFVALGAVSGVESKHSSLLNTLPIVDAAGLGADIALQLADRIREHLTPWGPATQLVDSPEYDPDGYWRGPIWAPSTMLIEDGLRRAGEVELADAVSDRFRRLCEQHGFAENFDAVTGEGLRDRAYTWTAAVYLVLARELVTRLE